MSSARFQPHKIAATQFAAGSSRQISIPPPTVPSSINRQILPPATAVDHSGHLTALATKWAGEMLERTNPKRPKVKERQGRTCRKCADPTCPGTKAVQHCTNPVSGLWKGCLESKTLQREMGLVNRIHVLCRRTIVTVASIEAVPPRVLPW
jgi:hypothetical protein